MRLAERLLLPRNPRDAESTYSWLGKRVAGLAEVADGLVTLFSPKNTYGRLSMNFVLWAAQTSLRQKIAERN